MAISSSRIAACLNSDLSDDDLFNAHQRWAISPDSSFSFSSSSPNGHSFSLEDWDLSETRPPIHRAIQAYHLLSCPDLGVRILSATDDPRVIARTAACSLACRVTAEGAAKRVCGTTYRGRKVIERTSCWVAVLGMMKGALQKTEALGHAAGVFRLLPLDDGCFVSSSKDLTLRVWRLDGQCILTMKGHTATITEVLQLTDFKLVTASNDGTLRVWSLCTGECEQILKGHAGRVKCVIRVGDRVVSGGEGTQILIWNMLSNLDCEHFIEHDEVGGICALAVLTGDRFVAGGHSGLICEWRIDGTCQSRTYTHSEAVWAIERFSDGRLMSASEDQTIRIWEPLVQGATTAGYVQVNVINLEDDRLDVTLSCVTKLSGQRIALGTLEGSIEIWDLSVQPARKCHVLNGHNKMVHMLLSLQDGRTLSASRDNTLRIWNDDSGQCEEILRGHTGSVTCIAELVDGRVVSGSNDSKILVWC